MPLCGIGIYSGNHRNSDVNFLYNSKRVFVLTSSIVLAST